MSARILDGKALAQTRRARLAQEVARFSAHAGAPPRLHVLAVGEDGPSLVYARSKLNAARSVGITATLEVLPTTTSEADLIVRMRAVGADSEVDGVLVELPLPPHVRESEIRRAMPVDKDVDGISPQSLGLVAIGEPRLVPATALGVVDLLRSTGHDPAARHVVVLGRSNVLGRPLALLLSRKGPGGNATVTLCHTRTRDTPSFARQADILVCAMGVPEAVDASWVRPGAVVVDVGIHSLADGRLTGDVHAASVAPVASALSPVPGGVGPMTDATLLANVLRAAELRRGEPAYPLLPE